MLDAHDRLRLTARPVATTDITLGFGLFFACPKLLSKHAALVVRCWRWVWVVNLEVSR